MPTPTARTRRAALCSSALALVLLPAACTAPRTARLDRAIPSVDADAGVGARLADPLDPGTAAARAVAVSPRVLAAAHRLDAGTARAEAAALPPDPTLALSLGIPIDGLGGFPVSISIMEGLAWLIHADEIKSGAERERTAAAAELVAASVEAAADARRLVRALDAARGQVLALQRAAAARAELVEIERARLATGESTAVLVATAEARLAEARIDAAAAELDEHELGASLASLLSIDRVPAVAATPDEGTAEAATTTTLDVIRARARVARAESALAASSAPFGANAAAGPAFSRDIEDRESIGGSIELAIPLFRRPHELAALASDLAAERAELAEAERRAKLDLDHARAQVETNRATLATALAALQSSDGARAALAASAAEGEAARAAVEEATAETESWRARAAQRRMELAASLYRIESRAMTSDQRTVEGDNQATPSDGSTQGAFR